MTKKTTGLLALLLSLIIAAIFVVHPRLSTVKASPSENNTSVFTGQFLPAFLGGAYDPTEAYKRIAGLPVYVFGYDRWAGSASMVINNYAIRTQIRADGSFQVQGLPTAAHYAVYFPYKLKADGGVERTDCVTGAGALDPCANDTAKTAEFRWPDDEDQIKDVFSYAQGDASTITIGNTQVDNQQVKLGKVFLTNETRVDIVNHINVFPLVPNKVLKIVLKDYTDDSSFEVVAQRIVGEKTEFEAASNSLMVPVNFPIIRGRTSSVLSPESGTPPSGYKIYNKFFQAYAPPGKYVINYWRTESNNPSYKDWDTKSPINSIKNGLSLEKVTRDWRAVLLDTDLIGPVWPNGIKIWGTVTDKDGYLMDGTDDNHLNVLVDLESDTGLENTYAGRNDESDPDKKFYAPGLGSDLPTRTIWGIYAIAQTIPESIALTFPTQIESPWVYVKNEAGKNYQQNPQPPKKPNTSSEFIRGTDGPKRIDLTVIQSATHTSGYDSGIVLNVTCSDPGCPEMSNASAAVRTTEAVSVEIPAITKTYGANRLGIIVIPDADLKRDQTYAIEIRAGNFIAFTGVEYPNNGWPGEKNIGLTRALAQGKDEYYKILGIVPVPFFKIAVAGDPNKLFGKFTLRQAAGLKLSNVSAVFKRTYGSTALSEEATCSPPECGIIQSDNSIKNEVPNDSLNKGETLQFVVPKPPTGAAATGRCLTDLSFTLSGALSSQAIRQVCASLGSGVVTDTYKLKIEGSYTSEGQTKKFSASQTFKIDSRDTEIKPFILTPTDTCDNAFSSATPGDVFSGGRNLIGNAICNFTSQLIGSTLYGAFDFIQKNGLQMQPITGEKAVIKIWGITRGLANIFFVILLIIIGIATILRLEPKSYNMGILLPRLFINIALANFSLLIVQLLIDTNNILTQTFFNLMEQGLQGVSWGDGGALIGIGTTAGAVAGTALTNGLTLVLSSALIGALLFAIFSGGALAIPILTFLLSLTISIVVFVLGLFLLFLIRYVLIWIVAVLAPIFFVISVLPSKTLSGIGSMFWNTLLPMIFMGPVMAFVFGMGMAVLTIGGDQNDILAGFGAIAMGIITLFSVAQVPSMLGGLFKGGLANLGLSGKGGTMEGAEQFVAGKLGAKDMATLQKERLNAPTMEGFAERGRLGSKFGALGGLIGGLTGRYAGEAERVKAVEAARKEGVGKTAEAELAEDKEFRDLQKATGIDNDKDLKAFKGFLSSRPEAEVFTGGRTVNAAGETVSSSMKVREFVNKYGGGYVADEKGGIKIKNEANAIKVFKNIGKQAIAEPVQLAATEEEQIFDRIRSNEANMKASRGRSREQTIPTST